MNVKIKCKGCKTFNDFVLYKDRESFALHFVFHDNKQNHYDKIPFMKRIGRKNILERDRYMRSTICLFFVCFVLLFLFMWSYQHWIVAFLLLAIGIMWEYVFIQLYMDDISGIQVFEHSFNNETKHNLQNMGVANCCNRVYEIIREPDFKFIYQNTYILNRYKTLINFLSTITFIRLGIVIWIWINRNRNRYSIVRQYLLRTPAMYKGIGFDICQKQEILDIIKSKKEELENKNLTVLGIEYIEKSIRYKK